MVKKTKRNFLVSTAVLIIIALSATAYNKTQTNDMQEVKIGIITDLTGPAAYWGESSIVGAQLAADELRQEGYTVELVIEDYGLDSLKALSSARKLIEFDQVDAIYAEFNPAAISAGAYLEGEEVLYVYDAAVTSPLKGNRLAFKTYLDYEEGCRQLSQRFKESGVDVIGVLKVNLEFGQLCLDGVKNVQGMTVIVEEYNLGDTDFKTQLLKMGQKGAQAVINVGFEGDTSNTLKVIRDQALDIRYGSTDDTITDAVADAHKEQLKGSLAFGFRDVLQNFAKKEGVSGLPSMYGAALAYTHTKQMARAIINCERETRCIRKEMSKSESDQTIGFRGYKNNIAQLNMEIIER